MTSDNGGAVPRFTRGAWESGEIVTRIGGGGVGGKASGLWRMKCDLMGEIDPLEPREHRDERREIPSEEGFAARDPELPHPEVDRDPSDPGDGGTSAPGPVASTHRGQLAMVTRRLPRSKRTMPYPGARSNSAVGSTPVS